MCGLLGVAGSISDPDRIVFHNLIWISAIRGDDGTGVASVAVGKPGEVMLVKSSGGPDRLFDRKQYYNAVGKDKMLMIGHCRKKTIGDSSYMNAHPFEFEHIVGAHNGGLSAYTRHRLKNPNSFDTDSETLFDHMNDEGVESTVKHLDSGPSDAYALTWYDKRDHTINFLRNAERPLYYVFNKSHTVLYWASEIAFLYTALNHNRINFVGKEVTYLAEDYHMSWVIPLKTGDVFGKAVRVQRKPVGFFPKDGKSSTSKQIGRFRRGGTSVTGVSTTTSTGTTIYAPGYGPEDDNVVRITPRAILKPEEYARSSATSDKQTASVAFDKLKYFPVMSRPIKSSLKDVTPYYIGYSGTDKLDGPAFDKKMSDGCVACTAQPAWGEPVLFLKDGHFLCASCVTQNTDQCLDVCREFL